MERNYTICETFYSTGTGFPFLAVDFPQFIACSITLLLVLIFSSKFFLKGCYHSNAKIIVFCQMFFVSMFCLYFLTAMSKHFFTVIMKSDEPCAFVQLAGDCKYFYYFHIFTLSGMSITQVFLSAERVISTKYVNSYESFGRSIGSCFFVTAVLFASLVTYYSMAEYNPMEPRLTCLGVPFTARHRSILLYIQVILCDLISLFLFIYTWRRSLKVDLVKGYYLGRRYQTKENLNVVKLFIPVNIAHFIMYCTYASATLLLRLHVDGIDLHIFPTLAMSVMLIPYYTTIELTMLNIMMKRNERKNSLHPESSRMGHEEQRNVYFKELYKQWNEAVS